LEIVRKKERKKRKEEDKNDEIVVIIIMMIKYLVCIHTSCFNIKKKRRKKKKGRYNQNFLEKKGRKDILLNKADKCLCHLPARTLSVLIIRSNTTTTSRKKSRGIGVDLIRIINNSTNICSSGSGGLFKRHSIEIGRKTARNRKIATVTQSSVHATSRMANGSSRGTPDVGMRCVDHGETFGDGGQLLPSPVLQGRKEE
jgi:hypothetical protein